MNRNALPAMILVAVVVYFIYKMKPTSAFAVGVGNLVHGIQSGLGGVQNGPTISLGQAKTILESAVQRSGNFASSNPNVTVNAPVWSNPDGSFVQIPMLDPNTPDLKAN